MEAHTIDIQDSRTIHASRDTVYKSLNDPGLLRQCIPGCQSLSKESDTQMTAKAQLKIGPIKAIFEGEVTLFDLNPPSAYSMRGKGKGGAAGFVQGEMNLALRESEGITIIDYTVNAVIGGKIAQLGNRIVAQAAVSLSREFFTKFAALVEDPEENLKNICQIGNQENSKEPHLKATPILLAIATIIAFAAYYWPMS